LIARGNRGGARSGEANEGKGRGRKEKRAQTSGLGPSATQRKKKKEERRWAAAGTGRWASGPAGLEREVRSFSIFFLFPFSNSFKIQTFSTQIHSKLFKLFHKIV
jgi:hypothetical protein